MQLFFFIIFFNISKYGRMNRLFPVFLILFIFVSSLVSFSQQIGIGEWRDELPYFQCISVTEAGTRIYSATPYAIFYYDRADNSVQRITKITGLSDIGISTINYNKDYNTLVIAYTNANIDMIKNNLIINISDIKRKTILGNKTINRIYFIGKYAYLCCGFGIVVLDIDKEEINDTYFIGPNGSPINVLGLTKDDHDTLFATTEKGLFLASFNNPNLANYSSWIKDKRLDTNSKYVEAVSYNGEVIINKRKTFPSHDTLYRYTNGKWTMWDQGLSNTIMNIETGYNFLTVSYDYFVHGFNTDYARVIDIYTYNPGGPVPNDAIPGAGNTVWVGDNYGGLIEYDMTAGTYRGINLSGPLTKNVFSTCINGNDLYIAGGGYDLSYNPPYNTAQIYHFDNTNWNNFSSSGTPGLGIVHDIVTITIDKNDSKRVYAGSWGRGLVEMYDGKVVNRYVESNSKLRHHTASDTSDIRVGGTAMDSQGALWVVNTHNNNCLSRKSGNDWIGYYIPQANESDLGQLLVDRNDQKWIVMRYSNINTNSLLVFTDNHTPENPTDDQAKTLNSSVGKGNIPGNNVFAMAEDLDGQIWIGTEQGIAVCYSPENLFNGQDFDFQRILVQQGNYTQYLLENETVTAIAVDGANQKWIGTDRGGIFLFSHDGTKQIYHFTEDNSPLFSNRITSIAINKEGEVFIGTDWGMISFKSTATPGGEGNEDVYAYPNPVKEGYSGWIAIKGLVKDAQVRITDITGNLVYSTKAQGGQAIWDGKNFNGKKAKSGVYLVFASNDTGSAKVVTKILIIN